MKSRTRRNRDGHSESTPMSCKSLRTKLELYAGDDLDGRESVAVVVHLRTCLACYREYVELRDMLTAVRASGRPRARGDAEVESLVAGVMGEIHGPPPPAPRLIERLTTVASVSGWAAALLLAFTLGWQVLSERTRDP